VKDISPASKSIEEVCLDFAEPFSTSGRSLDILCAYQGRTTFTLTWLPDWCQPWDRLSFLDVKMAFKLSVTSLWRWRASASLEASAVLSNYKRVLTVEGIRVCSICAVTKPWSAREVNLSPHQDIETEILALYCLYFGSYLRSIGFQAFKEYFYAALLNLFLGLQDDDLDRALVFSSARSSEWFELLWCDPNDELKELKGKTRRFFIYSEGRRYAILDTPRFFPAALVVEMKVVGSLD
jgi:hypothetical protein